MIVVPAAGEGRRFREAGYTEPKHLIPLGGVPLIDRVVRNLKALCPGEDVLVATRDVVGETRGTAETLARAPIGPGELLVGNCDQLIAVPDGEWKRGDGVIFSFPSACEAHSYLSTFGGRIAGITEKQVVSKHAVSGVYWFADSAPVLTACQRVCEHGSGELYLSAAIARLLEAGAELYAHETPTAILGTPEDFQRFAVAMSFAA